MLGHGRSAAMHLPDGQLAFAQPLLLPARQGILGEAGGMKVMATPPPSHRRRLTRRRGIRDAEGSQATTTRTNRLILHLRNRPERSRKWEVRVYRFDIPPSWSPFAGLVLLMLTAAVGAYQEVVTANWLLAICGCLVVVGSAFWLLILWRERRQPE